MSVYRHSGVRIGTCGLAVLLGLVAVSGSAFAQDSNAELVRNFYEVVFNERAVDRAGEFLSPEYRSNGPAHDRHVDLAATGGFIGETLAVFPDIRIEVMQVVADGDLVAVTWTASGTHSGNMLGLSATGNTVTVFGMSMFRVADGKIVEGWNAYDRYDLLLQLEPNEEDAAGDAPAPSAGE